MPSVRSPQMTHMLADAQGVLTVVQGGNVNKLVYMSLIPGLICVTGVTLTDEHACEALVIGHHWLGSQQSFTATKKKNMQPCVDLSFQWKKTVHGLQCCMVLFKG